MLTEQSYKVRSVTKGSTGLRAAQIAPPDLILLDINMPQMNGYEEQEIDRCLGDVDLPWADRHSVSNLKEIERKGYICTTSTDEPRKTSPL